MIGTKAEKEKEAKERKGEERTEKNRKEQKRTVVARGILCWQLSGGRLKGHYSDGLPELHPSLVYRLLGSGDPS